MSEQDLRHELLALEDSYFGLTIRMLEGRYIVTHNPLTQASAVAALRNRMRGETILAGIPAETASFEIDAAAERYAALIVREWRGRLGRPSHPPKPPERLLVSPQILLTIRADRRVNWGERPLVDAPSGDPTPSAAVYGSPLDDFHRRRRAANRAESRETADGDHWARFHLTSPSGARPMNMTLRPLVCDGAYFLPLAQYETETTVEVLLPHSCVKARTSMAIEHGGSNDTDSLVIDRLEASALRVARALVRRESVKLVVTGTLACWDSKTDTLYLPSYHVDEDPESPEAVLRYNAWRGLLDHECSHARNTTGVETHHAEWRARGWDVSRLHALWHVFEDPWIEAKWMQEYPGARRHIHAARTLTIRETGGAAPCWPDYTGKGGQPIGVFGAFIQSLLRLNTGIVAKAAISPDIAAMIDGCQDILSRFDPESPLTTSSTNAELTTALWERLLTFLPPEPTPEPTPEPESTPDDADSPGSNGASLPGEGNESGADEEGEGEGGGEGEEGDGGGEEEGDGGGEEEGDGEGEGELEGAAEGAGNTRGRPQDTPKDTRREEALGGPASGDPALTARDLVAGEWGEVASLSDIVAAGHVNASDTSTLPYTVHPDVEDEWIRPTQADRTALDRIRKGTSKEASYLAARLRRVIAARRADLRVGCQEDGDDIDLDSAALLATRLDSVRVWERTTSRIADETFVTVLIDCSGSMGDSTPEIVCPVHGRVAQKGDNCSRTTHTNGRCGQPLLRRAVTKSAHAVMTATLLHDALRVSRVPHCVLGYTTGWHSRHIEGENTTDPLTKRPRWSRTTPIVTYEFVRAPGNEVGDYLPAITGKNANADGSSLREAARYMVAKRGTCTRMVLVVVSDGLPACDDTEMEQVDLRRTVADLAAGGVEVYGVGVGMGERSNDKFASLYPDHPGDSKRAPTGHVLLSSTGMDRGVLDRLVSLFAAGNGRGGSGR